MATWTLFLQDIQDIFNITFSCREGERERERERERINPHSIHELSLRFVFFTSTDSPIYLFCFFCHGL